MTAIADDLRSALARADRSADARLRSHVDALWAAKADPDTARALLATLRREFDEAMAQLQAALVPGWWDQATPETIVTTYESARVWRDADADSEELARLFTSQLTARLTGFPCAA